MRQQIQYFHNSEKSVKDTTYDCQRTMVCPQYNTSWRLQCAVNKGSHKTKKHKIPQQNRRACKRTNSTVTTTTQRKKTKKGIGQPTYVKVNEEVFLDKPLHVILNKSKLAYRIYVILIANKELKK
jgi:hypothetical protein